MQKADHKPQKGKLEGSFLGFFFFFADIADMELGGMELGKCGGFLMIRLPLCCKPTA